MLLPKRLTATYIAGDHLSLENLSAVMDCLEPEPISEVPWPVFPFRPEVYFAIGYSEKSLFLKYYVTEAGFQARYRQTNDPVYRDSCVEFFVALNGEKNYYNFEFNCLGTCLAGFGSGRLGRTLLEVSQIALIRRKAELTNKTHSRKRKTNWELTLVLPHEAFAMHSLTSWKGVTFRVNFYKCGDDLPQPHYLSWSPIIAPDPNFHLPEYFGELILGNQ